ncbi:MAG: DMT family transporter [Lachnospiraceae bacterium]|nr:DMT family transporter [Lachnospiraceae bacterium]
MAGFFIAILSGALMSIQGVFNTQVTKASGIWSASAFVQLTAFVVCLGAWFGMERKSFLRVFSVEPKYMLLGGVIGALITYTVIKSMDSLGPAKAVLLIVVSQLAVAYGMELFGIFGVERQPFEWRKALGMGIAILGIITFHWK